MLGVDASMNQLKLWDEYEIRARYVPTFLSVIPMAHFLVLFLGEAFWKELSDNISLEWSSENGHRVKQR